MEPKTLNERYRLIEQIGTGGMATVYRGHDVLLDRPVAIKALREPYASDLEFNQRFLEEARAAGRLDHPNIVHIYDVGADDGRPYLVMELVPGEDLKTFIRRTAPLPIAQALEIARQICAGVGYAHRAGLIHCDLKPHNILLTPQGAVKVADFGIARAFEPERAPGANVAREQTVWGSPHYISPEQAAGEPPLPASDVYSIGVILYEMLTGVPPFHDEDTTALILKHLREEPGPMRALNPRIPPGLEWLVRKVLAKERTARYRNADQFGMALDEYLRQGGEFAAPQPAVTDPLATRQVITAPPSTPNRATPVAEAASEAASEKSGPDWLLWILWCMAAIAVFGLVALYAYIYKVYSAPPGPPPTTAITSTPTLETSAPLIGAPNLVNLSVPEAQRLVESYSLRLSIAGERVTAEALPGTVLEQEPRAGAQMPISATINVIVSAGQEFTLPNVVGYQLEVVLPNLEAQNLIVIKKEIWSSEPLGKILAQEPLPNSIVRAGSTMTLTLSGGINQPIPLEVNLNNLIMLEEAIVPQAIFHPGDTVPVTLKWRALQPVSRSYTVFVHLMASDLITLIGQHDSEPVNGLNPTNTWQSGVIVTDPHQIRVPEGVAPGAYVLQVGLYDAEGRLQVINSGRTVVANNSIRVTTINIQP